VTGAGFAQTLVLGGLAQPEATRKQQQQAASRVGMQVSVQGLEQRFREPAVVFMRSLLEIGLEQMVSSEVERTLLPAFNGVYITDCTRLVWAKTGVKMGVRWEIQQGQIQARLSALKQNDQKTAVVEYAMPAGALHLGDLGFFKLTRFQDWNAQGVYWLTRCKVGTRLQTAAGETLDLPRILETATAPVVVPVRVGVRAQVAAYLVAAPLPEAAYAKRQVRLQEQARLDMHPLSERQTALAGWTIYLTNIPDLSFAQAHTLARTRWQIELLFKLWKSHAKILVARTADPIRQQCEGYAKLLGVLVAHWLLLVSGWQPHTLGALDALRLLRSHVPLLMRAFRQPFLWTLLFDWLQADLRLAPPPSKRRKVPLAFQLWQNFSFSFP
jgi:Transposase DDE domain